MNQPTVLGHEFSGVVRSVGPNSDLKPGDRVVSLHWAQYGGEAWPSPFLHKKAMKTFLGLTCNGGYGEFVTCHETAFVRVPNPLDWTAIQAAPVMSTFGTVWQGAIITGGLKGGERVLVTGAAGGVGSSAVSIGSKIGAYVIGTTGNASTKGDYIRSLGANEVITAAPGFSKELKEGVDMVIECVGAPTFTDSLRSLKPGGRLILIGNVTNSSTSLPLGLCIVKSLSVIGTDSIEASNLSALFSWMDSHKMRPHVDIVLPLEDASEGHRMVEERIVNGRVVLDVNSHIW
jgi:acryloyl-coenzyme A reductase